MECLFFSNISFSLNKVEKDTTVATTLWDEKRKKIKIKKLTVTNKKKNNFFKKDNALREPKKRENPNKKYKKKNKINKKKIVCQTNTTRR